MSNTKMLIDATHPEETRVVVQRNGRVEEFDFESAARKLLRGNIYLAKVTRVEPSLQAAFVDYGGNRHGFLAFNEIHPDYYQIPVADRQALIDEEAAAEAELEAAADRRADALARRSGGQRSSPPALSSDAHHGAHDGPHDDDAIDDDAPLASSAGEDSHIVDVEEDEHIEEVGGEAGDDAPQTIAARSHDDADMISETPHRPNLADAAEPDAAGVEHAPAQFDGDADDDVDGRSDNAPDDDGPDHEDGDACDHQGGHAAADHDGEHDHDHDDDRDTEGLATAAAPMASELDGAAHDDAPSADYQEEAPQRQRRRQRSYKIQEVIKRRQVILVQVVKEERGNKGAALTTYLSLAGRYTVLMPNTARGGGISRKITNPQDRKRLKAIAQELEVPEGMGLIIRTAGAARTKQEIKRDFEYLLRLWESVRDLTLQSTAPSLVYEEGDLIKRSIRDLYNKDVEEVVVAGEAGYQEAADFMQMLMPSHAKNVIDYKDPTPLFTRYGVERQLNAMFLPQVTLRSGGYIVINQTEALVAIDVNSGKSTREFSIEETAIATNLEAADEIARQLKLRDLAGLIVIDFIDMEEKRNNRSVERRLKDALRFDRARIQLGRISHFGLMEMSRQRLRTGVLEGSTSQCPHCQGTGIIRSTESIALAVLRGLEDTITAGAASPLVATTTPAVALYILNSKRVYITDMEARHGYTVTVLGSDRVQGANFTIDRGAPALPIARRPERAAVNMNWGFEGEVEGEDEAPAYEASNIEMVDDPDDHDEPAQGEARGRERGDSDEDGKSRGRRRRRGRGRGGRDERGDDTRRSEPRGDRNGDRINGQPRFAVGDEQPIMDDVGAETNANDAIGDEADGDNGERVARPLGEQAEDARGDRAGRRRRRGRRGGRRGRERDGSDTPRSNGNGNGVGGEPALASEDNGADAGDADRSHAAAAGSPPAQTHERSNERGAPERQRPARIWDVPQSKEIFVDADMAPLESVHATHETPMSVVADVEHASNDGRPAAAATTPPAAAPTKPATATTKRHELGSSEPRIERVVVTPDQASDADGDSAAPQRKGWWQRRFGAE